MSMTGVLWSLGLEHIHHICTSSPTHCQDLIWSLHVGTCQVNDVCLALLGQRQHLPAIASIPDESNEGLILSPFALRPFAFRPGLLPFGQDTEASDKGSCLGFGQTCCKTGCFSLSMPCVANRLLTSRRVSRHKWTISHVAQMTRRLRLW